MWIVAKYNSKELEVFKKELSDKLDKDVEYYHPKIKVDNTSKVKKFKYILDRYIFCQSKKFLNQKFISSASNLRGLDYFLKDCLNYQDEITKFINFCKTNEDIDGSLKRSFFNFSISFKACSLVIFFISLFFIYILLINLHFIGSFADAL